MKPQNAIRIVVAALSLSVARQASAQSITGQVVGRVLDAESGKAVAGATVTASSPGWIDQSVKTDATGYYVIATPAAQPLPGGGAGDRLRGAAAARAPG